MSIETVRYTLAGKEDIKLEPRNGTFPVTLADGRTVTMSALDIAYLLSDASTKANLSATNDIPGMLKRVTDDVRGLWMRGGSQWFSLASEIVNVEEFGAKGDDATDDTAAIQAAVDVLPSTGGRVRFVRGRIYRVTQITVGTGVCLDLNGATLKKTASGGTNFSGIVTNKDQTNGNTDIMIMGGTFHRTVETTTAFDEHIYFKHCSRVWVVNNRFLGTITLGEHEAKGVHYHGCQYTVTCNNIFNEIPDNALAYNPLTGKEAGYHGASGNIFSRASSDTGAIIIVAQHSVTIFDNIFKGTGTGNLGNWIETGEAASGVTSKYLTIVGNTIEGFPACLLHEVSFVTVSNNTIKGIIRAALVTGRSDHISIVGNTVEQGQIQVTSADHVLVADNLVDGAGFVGTGGEGIEIRGSSHVSIHGNRIRRCQGSGIYVEGITGSLKIENNVTHDNGLDGSADNWFGIFAQPPDDAVIANNVAFDTQASKTQRHGIGVLGATRLTLVNNVSRDNLIGAFRELSASTYALRTNNIFDGVLDRVSVGVVATASLPAAAAAQDGTVIIEDAGAGAGHLIIYKGGQRFRCSGGAAF